jgi:hypothetical protein
MRMNRVMFSGRLAGQIQGPFLAKQQAGTIGLDAMLPLGDDVDLWVWPKSGKVSAVDFTRLRAGAPRTAFFRLLLPAVAR